MSVCDFGRSFATFTTARRANNARIQVEAICDLGDTRYVLVASCKSEATYADDDLFTQPNYDFCAIYSDTEYQIVRVGLPLADEWREAGLIADRFEAVSIDLADTPARECADPREIVEATLEGDPLVGVTELLDETGATYARLEYPVKTMNVNDQRLSYQVDTGPIVAPDMTGIAALEVQRLKLAFVVWNRPDRAELIAQQPTPIGNQSAGHYSGIRKCAAHNSMWRVEQS